MAKSHNDDLSRNVYCILGVPIDKVDLATAIHRIEIAANHTAPFLISTPNLNFLVNSQSDPEFRESLLISELCPADGIVIVWLARLLRIPIKERVAGSDIFESLKLARSSGQRLRVFFFGGEEGVAEAAAARLQSPGLMCVGALYPGFGTVEQMSNEDIINTINASNAHILSVSLGAKKGQSWLLHNHASLRVPVRVHLGAIVNFEAGTVKRAPRWMRKWGLEWLWRIKEEPNLWIRYAHDGFVLIRMLLTRVAPLGLADLWQRFKGNLNKPKLAISEKGDNQSVTFHLQGVAIARTINPARACFQSALSIEKNVTLDLSKLSYVDACFLGLLIMLRKQLLSSGLSLRLVGATSWVARIFRLNGLEFLLSTAAGGPAESASEGLLPGKSAAYD